MWNASRFCVSSLRRGHANLLCIVPILVYVLPKQVHLLVWFLKLYPLVGYMTVCVCVQVMSNKEEIRGGKNDIFFKFH